MNENNEFVNKHFYEKKTFLKLKPIYTFSFVVLLNHFELGTFVYNFENLVHDTFLL